VAESLSDNDPGDEQSDPEYPTLEDSIMAQRFLDTNVDDEIADVIRTALRAPTEYYGVTLHIPNSEFQIDLYLLGRLNLTRTCGIRLVADAAVPHGEAWLYQQDRCIAKLIGSD
jgi:hypothetical protein